MEGLFARTTVGGGADDVVGAAALSSGEVAVWRRGWVDLVSLGAADGARPAPRGSRPVFGTVLAQCAVPGEPARLAAVSDAAQLTLLEARRAAGGASLDVHAVWRAGLAAPGAGAACVACAGDGSLIAAWAAGERAVRVFAPAAGDAAKFEERAALDLPADAEAVCGLAVLGGAAQSVAMSFCPRGGAGRAAVLVAPLDGDSRVAGARFLGAPYLLAAPGAGAFLAVGSRGAAVEAVMVDAAGPRVQSLPALAAGGAVLAHAASPAGVLLQRESGEISLLCRVRGWEGGAAPSVACAPVGRVARPSRALAVSGAAVLAGGEVLDADWDAPSLVGRDGDGDGDDGGDDGNMPASVRDCDTGAGHIFVCDGGGAVRALYGGVPAATVSAADGVAAGAVGLHTLAPAGPGGAADLAVFSFVGATRAMRVSGDDGLTDVSDACGLDLDRPTLAAVYAGGAAGAGDVVVQAHAGGMVAARRGAMVSRWVAPRAATAFALQPTARGVAAVACVGAGAGGADEAVRVTFTSATARWEAEPLRTATGGACSCAAALGDGHSAVLGTHTARLLVLGAGGRVAASADLRAVAAASPDAGDGDGGGAVPESVAVLCGGAAVYVGLRDGTLCRAALPALGGLAAVRRLGSLPVRLVPLGPGRGALALSDAAWFVDEAGGVVPVGMRRGFAHAAPLAAGLVLALERGGREAAAVVALEAGRRAGSRRVRAPRGARLVRHHAAAGALVVAGPAGVSLVGLGADEGAELFRYELPDGAGRPTSLELWGGSRVVVGTAGGRVVALELRREPPSLAETALVSFEGPVLHAAAVGEHSIVAAAGPHVHLLTLRAHLVGALGGSAAAAPAAPAGEDEARRANELVHVACARARSPVAGLCAWAGPGGALEDASVAVTDELRGVTVYAVRARDGPARLRSAGLDMPRSYVMAQSAWEHVPRFSTALVRLAPGVLAGADAHGGVFALRADMASLLAYFSVGGGRPAAVRLRGGGGMSVVMENGSVVTLLPVGAEQLRALEELQRRAALDERTRPPLGNDHEVYRSLLSRRRAVVDGDLLATVVAAGAAHRERLCAGLDGGVVGAFLDELLRVVC